MLKICIKSMMNRERVENAFSKLSKICQTTDHMIRFLFHFRKIVLTDPLKLKCLRCRVFKMNGKMIKHNFKRRNYINYIHLSNFVQESCVSGFDRVVLVSVAGKTTLDREGSNLKSFDVSR